MEEEEEDILDDNKSRPKTARYTKTGAANLSRQNESTASKQNSVYQQDSAAERQEQQQWGLHRLNPHQMRILNDKLDEFQDKPRNMSEPRMKYVPSPDLRPEALEEADEVQRTILLQQMKQIQDTGITPTSHFSYDF